MFLIVWLWGNSLHRNVYSLDGRVLDATGSGRQGEPGSTREAQEALGKPRDAPKTPQEQLRNERREFQENRVFRPWEASGGPRGTQNRWGGLAGAKGKPKVIPGYPKEEGF